MVHQVRPSFSGLLLVSLLAAITSSSACFNTPGDGRTPAADAGAAGDPDAPGNGAGQHEDASADGAGDSGAPFTDTDHHEDAGVGASGSDAGQHEDAGAEAPLPFEAHLVLRFETDAPDGLQPDGAWRDLSPGAHSVSLSAGTPVIETVGDSGAKVMVFGEDAPVFDIEDAPDLQFGATDDFFVVARTTIEVPLEAAGGCYFHYLLGKYADDNATGLQLRVCAPNTGRRLIGAVSLLVADASVAVPDALQTGFGVVSFGRNESGTRIETNAGDATFEQTIPLTDVSAPGMPLVVGAARAHGGTLLGGHLGRVNRLYVFRAPAGTFTAEDFEAIRDAVRDATPMPDDGGADSMKTVAVALLGDGDGTVTSSPAGISCGATCSESFPSGDIVTLSASPAGGSTFVGWGGACDGTDACMVNVMEPTSVTATFVTNSCEAPSFSLGNDAPAAGVGPDSVAVGDLDGDGAPDLAVANHDGADVSVLLGDGTGGFGMPVNFAVGGYPFSVSIADLDADGLLDLAVANLYEIAILLGNGDGSFQPATAHGTGGNPIDVAVADLDGDSAQDLVVANTNSGPLSILMGAGDGTFAAPDSYQVGPSPNATAVADLDADGILDIATAVANGQSVAVVLGQGGGALAAATHHAASSSGGPYDVAAGDLDGDGIPDLVAVGLNGASVLLGQGDGSFQQATDYATGTGAFAVALADLTSDAILDVAIANPGSDRVFVLQGAGDGTFLPAVAYETGATPESIVATDLDGDGLPDLVTANRSSDDVTLLMHTGTCVN